MSPGNAHGNDSGILHAHLAHHGRHRIQVVGMIVGIGDEQNGFGAVLPRIDRLVHESGVRRQVLSVEAAVWVQLLRLVAQHQDDFAVHVEVLIVVPLQIGCGNAIPCEYERGIDFRRRF